MWRAWVTVVASAAVSCHLKKKNPHLRVKKQVK